MTMLRPATAITIWEAISEGVKSLKPLTETPLLDSLVLLGNATGLSKERLFASLSDSLEASSYSRFSNHIQRRLEGIPVAYIRGRKEFYGMSFRVNEHVLVPRPDTETLVDAALGRIKERSGPWAVHDTCTGSGCIAIAIARECSEDPGVVVSASDVSEAALSLCQKNCEDLLGKSLLAFKSDLLQEIPENFDLIVSNPPYLKSSEVDALKENNWPEPRLTLDGGSKGLDILFRLIIEGRKHLRPGGRLLLEAAPQQMEILEKKFVQFAYSKIRIYNDLAGKERVIEGCASAPRIIEGLCAG